ALTDYADLQGPTSRTVLWAISDILKKQGTHPELEEQFRSLSNPGSKKEYTEFIKKHRTILDVLESYPEIKQFPLAEFLCGFQVIAPRRYSISSSPKVVGKSFATISVGIVNDVENGKSYSGVSSGYLASLGTNQNIVAAVRRCKDEAFQTPSDPSIPIVMICAGTGISPFLGFLQDRQASQFKTKEKGGISSTVLYFGCRNEDDFIYHEELDEFLRDGTLNEIKVAFSRPKTGGKKNYVQNVLLENAVEIWKFLKNTPGKIFVCGSASGMARDVTKTIETISIQIGGINEIKATEFVNKLQEDERIIMDVWG
ncbi:multidrug-resistance type transporter aminotriazole resistance, partial [Nowakowskiella sp. JEL0078]